MRAWTDDDIPSLEADLRLWGFKPVHARRLLRAFYAGNGSIDFDAIGTPLALRGVLERQRRATRSQVVRQHTSADGTVKLLIETDAGGAVESVLMPGYRDARAAACVSSQIGCAMGCDFCASTRGGLRRNLEAGEIVDQYLHLKRLASRLGHRLTSLVFMGMGEPMHNLDAVLPAIRRIADPDVGGLGWRQVTVSTVGVVPGIDRLADADLNVHLAVSLHAADDALRSRLVPMNRRWTVAEVMAAARRFSERTGRIPTIEWCLLDGVNDTDEQAGKLATLMDGFRAHVNLIPYNAIGTGLSGTVYTKPSPGRMARFASILRQRGVVAHFRDTRGDDIAGACGQLAATTPAP